MALMTVKQYAGYIGLSTRQLWNYIYAGRLEGYYKISERVAIIDTDKAKILEPANTSRRLDGKSIGRSKPLRGEKNFGRKDWRTCED